MMLSLEVVRRRRDSEEAALTTNMYRGAKVREDVYYLGKLGWLIEPISALPPKHLSDSIVFYTQWIYMLPRSIDDTQGIVRYSPAPPSPSTPIQSGLSLR